MSVNELQALAKQFADAFDQRDLKTLLGMLSDDLEVFDHVPFRFDGKPLFAKYLNEVVEGLASASFGFRQPSCRVYGDTVGIVNAHDMFTGVTKDGKVLSIHGLMSWTYLSITTSWAGGATSPPGSSQRCTPRRFATASPRCADLGKLTCWIGI